MTLTAMVDGVRVDLSEADNEVWTAVRSTKAIVCCGCGGRMHGRARALPVLDAARTGLREVRIFAHNPHEAAKCRMLGHDESPEHHALKARLAQAARRAGWNADVEVMGDECRADVVATSPDGRNSWALEAQLAGLSVPDAEARHEKYVHQWGSATWAHTGTRDWAERIPCLRVDSAHHDTVIGGVYLDQGGEQVAPDAPLTDTVPRVLNQELIYIYPTGVTGWGFYMDRFVALGVTAKSRRRRTHAVTGENLTVSCTRVLTGAAETSVLASADLNFDCPRCATSTTAPFYGPCARCRLELRLRKNF